MTKKQPKSPAAAHIAVVNITPAKGKPMIPAGSRIPADALPPDLFDKLLARDRIRPITDKENDNDS